MQIAWKALLMAALLPILPARAETRFVTSDADAGEGTLRAALLAAGSGDAIEFAIDGEDVKTIYLESELPPVPAGATIDGCTQSGAVCASSPPTLMVELEGGGTPPGASGLRIQANGVTVRGLVVNSFPLHGVLVSNAGHTVIETCRIGTDVTGTLDFGNGGDGIFLEAASDTRIGGSTPAGNLISANAANGIEIGALSSGTQLLDNRIGTDATDMAALPNGEAGVFILDAATGSEVEANTIRFNSGGGVVVTGTGTLGHRIRTNSMSENGNNGIDLVGEFFEDANDEDDPDAGPNRLQNWPEMASATWSPGPQRLDVEVYVPTAPANASFPLTLDFYRADVDAEEGEVYLGTAPFTVQDFESGSALVHLSPGPGLVQVGDVVVATATDADGNSSEFSDDGVTLPEPDTAFTDLLAMAALPLGATAARRKRANS